MKQRRVPMMTCDVWIRKHGSYPWGGLLTLTVESRNENLSSSSMTLNKLQDLPTNSALSELSKNQEKLIPSIITEWFSVDTIAKHPMKVPQRQSWWLHLFLFFHDLLVVARLHCDKDKNHLVSCIADEWGREKKCKMSERESPSEISISTTQLFFCF